MSVFQRGKVWWIDVKHQGLRHQESIGYDEKKAHAREAEVMLLMRAGKLVEVLVRGVSSTKSIKGGQPTVATAFRAAWKIRWGGIPKFRPASSVKGTRTGAVLDRAGIWTKYNRIVALIGTIELEHLKPSDVADMLNTLRENHQLADPTMRRYLSCLQTALAVALDDGLTTRVFSFRVLRNGLTESEGRKRIMTDEECEKALEYILDRKKFNRFCTRLEKTEILHAYFLTLFTLGCRVTETLMLKVGDLDLKSLTINIRATTTKSRRGRVLPIGGLAEVLSGLAGSRGAEDRLFEITAQTVSRMWKGLRKYLGMTDDPEFVPHCIRHTAGTFLANNVPLPVAQQILGHADVSTTMLYVHPHTDDLRAAQRTLELKMNLKSPSSSTMTKTVDENCRPNEG